MPLSVSLLDSRYATGRVDVLRFESPTCGGTVVFHPRYQTWLRKLGLDSVSAIWQSAGEVVSGHPSRHVCRIPLAQGRSLFLKREHSVGWRIRLRNRLAGFGPISRSEREAITLQYLDRIGLPVPSWLAYGTTGDGRAFLLLDECAGSVSWRQLDFDERHIEAIGRTIAGFHDAGVATPEISAKHLFVDRSTGRISLIDWQNSPPPAPVAWRDRINSLGRLIASITKDISIDHLLDSYLNACRGPVPQLSDCRSLVFSKPNHSHRKSSSESPNTCTSEVRFIWKNDERLVIVAGADWPGEWDRAERTQCREWTTWNPLGRLAAFVRSQPWRSPAAHVARRLVQFQHHNVPAPRIRAYGQTLGSFARSRCFVLIDQPIRKQRLPRKDWLDAARLLRQAHDAGMRVVGHFPPLAVRPDGRLVCNAMDAWERGRPIRVVSDLIRAVSLFNFSITRTDRLRFLRTYLSTGRTIAWPRHAVRSFVMGVS